MAFNQYTPNAADPLFNIYNKYGSFDEYRKSADFRPEEATGLEYRYSTTGKGAAPVGGWKSDFVSDYGITNKGTLNYNTNYQNQWGNLPTAENVRQIQATSPAATVPPASGMLSGTPPPTGGPAPVENRPNPGSELTSPLTWSGGVEGYPLNGGLNRPNVVGDWTRYVQNNPGQPSQSYIGMPSFPVPQVQTPNFAALANSLLAQAPAGATAPTYNPYAFSAPSTSQPDLASGLINTAQGSRDRYANMLQAYAARGLRNPFRMA